ncbi:transporter [Labrys sp. LIt4]|uniref:transporter n=1 Tax=Labrys sp. LIt4 TaxID=2821355 RepID=UPI001AE040BB|nr:transporter [Labrys sp. LIt4]MBP0579826.1 transporter [Labrys sp. LIt4]
MTSKLRRKALACAALMTCLMEPNAAKAIDIYPGDYTALPSGTNLALGYFGFTANSRLDIEGIGKIPKSRYQTAVGILRYLHYSDINGMPIAVQAFLPIGGFTQHQIGGVDARSKSGIGDLTLGFTVFPLHGADQPGGTTVGLTAYVSAPTGNYSARAPFNIGTGTWYFTPQLGVIQNLGKGFFIDAAADVALYIDHTEYGLKRSQDPSVQLQAYLRYQLSPATSVSFGYSGHFGGKQSVGGTYTGLKTDSHGLRAFASHMLTPTWQISGVVGADITNAKGGFRNDFTGQIRLMKIF